jgi:hypothetical protein
VGANSSLGGSPADYRDLLIYRSALNADEMAALEEGRLLQASLLEVYSPLAGMKVQPGGTVRNWRRTSRQPRSPRPASNTPAGDRIG